jgi:hypothetical protein
MRRNMVLSIWINNQTQDGSEGRRLKGFGFVWISFPKETNQPLNEWLHGALQATVCGLKWEKEKEAPCAQQSSQRAVKKHSTEPPYFYLPL